MFKRGGWLRNKIKSDEGFTVEVGGNTLVYLEGNRRMTVTIITEPSGYTVAEETIGRWDDDLQHRIPEEERHRITRNIQLALKSQGYNVAMF
jgi:hypothetical protein